VDDVRFDPGMAELAAADETSPKQGRRTIGSSDSFVLLQHPGRVPWQTAASAFLFSSCEPCIPDEEDSLSGAASQICFRNPKSEGVHEDDRKYPDYLARISAAESVPELAGVEAFLGNKELKFE